MRHTVEIGDSQGNTMQLSVDVDNIANGGSWRSIDKGMIIHNSGPVNQYDDSFFSGDTNIQLQTAEDGTWGIDLQKFVSWGTVNDQGTGTLVQPWVITLTPGVIEWSIA